MGVKLLKKICPNCKNIFYTYKSINAVCCCQQCSRKFLKEKWYKKRVRNCVICKTPFVPSHPKAKNLYCSHKCSGIGHIKEKINRSGYVYIHAPFHPFATKQGLVAEHKILIEAKIGRYLKKGEKVHHINHKPGDNRIENLLLCKDESEHKIVHNGLKYGVSKKENPKEWWKRINKALGDRHKRG